MGPVLVLIVWVYVGAWREKRKVRRAKGGRG
jgi:hypothetical protein